MSPFRPLSGRSIWRVGRELDTLPLHDTAAVPFFCSKKHSKSIHLPSRGPYLGVHRPKKGDTPTPPSKTPTPRMFRTGQLPSCVGLPIEATHPSNWSGPSPVTQSRSVEGRRTKNNRSSRGSTPHPRPQLLGPSSSRYEGNRDLETNQLLNKSRRRTHSRPCSPRVFRPVLGSPGGSQDISRKNTVTHLMPKH